MPRPPNVALEESRLYNLLQFHPVHHPDVVFLFAIILRFVPRGFKIVLIKMLPGWSSELQRVRKECESSQGWKEIYTSHVMLRGTRGAALSIPAILNLVEMSPLYSGGTPFDWPWKNFCAAASNGNAK
jgi:hypothetical protein